MIAGTTTAWSIFTHRMVKLAQFLPEPASCASRMEEGDRFAEDSLVPLATLNPDLASTLVLPWYACRGDQPIRRGNSDPTPDLCRL